MEHIILFEKANQYCEENQFDKAINCYEKAILIKSDYIEAYYHLANLHHQIGNLDKAVRNFKKIVALNPDYSKNHSNKILLVIYFFLQGDINSALETLKILIDSNPVMHFYSI